MKYIQNHQIQEFGRSNHNYFIDRLHFLLSRGAHREKIASAAQVLFMKKGTGAATMDDVAKAAGYSKATLYVYFKNKEAYIEKSMNLSKQKFLEYGFETLYRSVSIRGGVQ